MSRSTRVFDFVASEKDVDRMLKQRAFTHLFMSDAKWVKCFRALDDCAPSYSAVWKFIGDEAPKPAIRPAVPDKESRRRHYIDGAFWHGPRHYKEIEWIEFPSFVKRWGMKDVPAASRKQDLAAVRTALEAAGRFELGETTTGLRLYGYKP